MDKIMIKLKTYDDGLDMIQGCIRRSLNTRITRLRRTSTTMKIGHYEDLLARIDALGLVKTHLPKALETPIFKGFFYLCISTAKIMLGFGMQLIP
jgi:hypothetical protein